MAESRPNILLIQADQLAAPALPVYGHPVVKTPNISALAESGVIFDSAYCNSPICAPSRFSMLSGLLPSEIGAYDNAAEFPAGVPTFAHHLRALGYRTIVAGKMHFVGPDQLHGFEERLTTDIYPADFGWTPDWRDPTGHQDYFHTMLSVVEAGPCDRSLQLDFDEEVTFQSLRKIHDLARDDDGRPFLFYVSFTHPHDPYSITRTHWDRYDPTEIDFPSVPAMGRDAHDVHSQRIHDMCGMDKYELTQERVRNARHAYYGAISFVDDKIGELLQALRITGQMDNTVIMLTADHGDMLGERGLWYKMTFYEWAARVPLVLHAPGRFATRRVGANVSLLDLYPTVLDLAQAYDTGQTLPGRSLLPHAQGEANDESATVYGEYLAEGAAGPLVMIRRGHFKYIEGVDSPPQLFDIDDDPRELTDLAERPEHADTVAAFASEVHARWDFAALTEAVMTSQARRRLTFQALRRGRQTPWDFQPFADASQRYVRNDSYILGDLERRARLPYRDEPAPDGPTE